MWLQRCEGSLWSFSSCENHIISLGGKDITPTQGVSWKKIEHFELLKGLDSETLILAKLSEYANKQPDKKV